MALNNLYFTRFLKPTRHKQGTNNNESVGSAVGSVGIYKVKTNKLVEQNE